MRLVAVKLTDDQYHDLVRTGHQVSKRSLSEHIRGVLVDAKAMRPADVKTSTRLPGLPLFPGQPLPSRSSKLRRRSTRRRRGDRPALT